MSDVPANYDAAVRLAHEATSPRARALTRLEAFVDGTQYDGLPDWFSDRVPLWERAPCIVHASAKTAIESNVDLVVGEGRFPHVSSRHTWAEADETASEESVKEEADQAIGAVIKQARLASVAREVFAHGQSCRSAVAIFGIRSGRLFIDTTKAAWCTPTLDAEGACTRLEIQYAFIDQVKEGNAVRGVAKLYRRVIDDQTDITYKTVELGSGAPKWVPDVAMQHGFGFCPVVWYPHMRGCSIVGNVDGKALHENQLDEIRGLDFALSQRHRAALYAGDPQWTETGVSPGYNPTDGGRQPVVIQQSSPHGGTPSVANPAHRGGYVDGARPSRKARKKSPGTVWQYQDPNTKITLHTLPGDALKALDEHCADLLHKLGEAWSVVLLSPENIRFAGVVSGKALEALRSRQYARCDQYRDDFGDRFLLPAVGMLLRIADAKRLRVVGLDRIRALVATAGDMWSWHCPPFDLKWGAYSKPDPDEQGKLVAMAVAAKDGGLATVRAAVEMLREILHVEDIDAYLDELEEEAAQRAEQLHDSMKALAGDANADGQGDAEPKRTRRGAKAPSNAGSGGDAGRGSRDASVAQRGNAARGE